MKTSQQSRTRWRIRDSVELLNFEKVIEPEFGLFKTQLARIRHLGAERAAKRNLLNLARNLAL